MHALGQSCRVQGYSTARRVGEAAGAPAHALLVGCDPYIHQVHRRDGELLTHYPRKPGAPLLWRLGHGLQQNTRKGSANIQKTHGVPTLCVPQRCGNFLRSASPQAAVIPALLSDSSA
jgi:hypothetical protein